MQNLNYSPNREGESDEVLHYTKGAFHYEMDKFKGFVIYSFCLKIYISVNNIYQEIQSVHRLVNFNFIRI